MVFGNERLALHDYIAKTKVVRTVSRPRVQQAMVSASFMVGLTLFGYFVTRAGKTSGPLPVTGPQEAFSLRAVVSQVPAIVTVYLYDDHGKSVTQGSGFLLSSDGICVTNFHVIRDALAADVKLGDGRLYQLLSVQGYDADRDIAVIQLGRKTGNGIQMPADLPFLTLAVDKAQVGDHIATVGSPEGLSNSVTDGIVSAIRPGDGLTLLQITAPISPGSSGGPVFNLKGEVVAITSYQLREGQNLNFAIPADEISSVQSQKAHLSLEQIYWQVHTPQRPQEAQRTAPQLPYAYGTKSDGTERLTGSFTGSVHNLDSDLRALFGIFVEQKGQIVLGCMAVRAPLYGSGPLTGLVDGAEVQFDVTSGLFTIHFQGQKQGTHLSGTYRVLAPDAPTQYGEFALEKKDGKQLPNNFEPDKDCPTDTDMNK
jgi:S1-C subfamily serine protease